MTGSFKGTANLGGESFTAASDSFGTQSEDAYVVKFSSSGLHVWSMALGDTFGQLQKGQSVAVDSLGNVIVTGTVAGAVDFGDGSTNMIGDLAVFLAKY